MTRTDSLPHDEVYWHASAPVQELTGPGPDYSKPHPVVIIGGGMAGLMCAQRLIDAGVRATLLEDSFCGGGATGRSSGFITPDSELELSDVVRNEGVAEARRIWEFARGGVQSIDETIRRYGLECDYQVQDSLFAAGSSKGARTVKTEHETLLQLGYDARYYDASEVRGILGSDAYFGAVRTPETFGISAHRYCQTLKKSLADRGVGIFERTPVVRIEGHRLRTAGGTLTAEKIIVCTDRFLPRLRVIPRDIYHAQTFLAVTKPLSDRQIAAIFPEDPLMVWDTDLIYQYFRMTGDGRLLIGAASLFYTYARVEKHNPRRVLKKMHTYLSKRFPSFPIELEYVWPGLIGVSKDFMPLAGVDARNPDLYYVGGAAGLPFAAALGQYIAEKVLVGRDDFDGHFTARRSFPVSRGAQAILRKPAAFALSHGIAKYLAH